MWKFSLMLTVILGVVFPLQMSLAGEDAGVKKQEAVKNITLIHAGELLAVPGEDVLTAQTIVVEGEKITAVHAGYKSKDDLQIPYAKVVDLKDKFVLPGLMDMHVHLTAEGAADDRALAGVINARKTLMAGYTTVRDVGSMGATVFKLREKVKSGAIDGPRIFASGQIISVGDNNEGGLECNGPESCRRTTRELITSGADWIKIRASCRGGRLCSNENGASVFFADEMAAITQVAAKYGVKIAAHSHPRESALFVLKYGVSSIEHGSFMDDKALRAMKRQGVFFVPTLSVHDTLEGLKADGKVTGKDLAHIDSFLSLHPDTLLRAYKAGVKIATGSDAGGQPHGENYREIERFVALGIPAMDALKMATVNGAALLDRSDDLGTVESGKYADIIALSASPLAAVENIEKVEFVMKAGRIYKQ